MTAEFFLFLAIGLGILLFEAHRQFNHPAYTKEVDEGVGDAQVDYIFSLSPSEIRNRSAFFSAELVYILTIVVFYLLLVFNDAVNNVLQFIIEFTAQKAAPGGAVPGAGAGEGGAATGVSGTTGTRPIDQAAEPFVLSMMMVTAIRFPLVRRIEVLLRSWAQRLFGIPWIPERLRQRIADTPIDIAAIGAGLSADDAEDAVEYRERIERYGTTALQIGLSHRDAGDFTAHLAKLAAYQLWVNDLKLWPSHDFRSDFRFFRDLNDPVSDQINTLFKDCDLLASAPAAPGEADDKQRMQQELWELKAKQAGQLARRMATMMALYDQNSNLPDPEKPGAESLRAFLKQVRAQDQAKVFQINFAIILVLISAVVSFLAGYVHAAKLAGIARELGLFEQVGADDPQFDTWLTARNFALSSLIVYGLSMWGALDIRRRLRRRGSYVNPFDATGRIPPMGQIAGLFLVLVAIVFTATLAYLLATSPGWSPLGERTEAWWDNVWAQANLSLLFGFIGAFHGTAVALMMDLGAARAETRRWLIVAGCYIVTMMLLGFLLGQYLSPHSRPEIRAMREMLYTVDLGLIALFTSVAMTLLIGPRTETARLPGRRQAGARAR